MIALVAIAHYVSRLGRTRGWRAAALKDPVVSLVAAAVVWMPLSMILGAWTL